MIPEEEVERVRASADIVQIIGEHVSLRRVGNDWRGPCPFHQGTHRNFSVSPRRQLYHCFVCDEKGSVFTFLQRRLGIDFPAAVRMVAEKSGMQLREVRSGREGPDPREPLWEVNAAAAEFFRSVLWDDPLGAAARDYLASRALPRELAERFAVGFAPREIGLLRAHLNSLGYSDERQLEAGILLRREEAEEPRPRFRGRLTFPIHDPSGRVVGFGGRNLDQGEPKYLNSADSSIFSKRTLLYRLHEARLSARRDDRMLVVEGYFDVMRIIAAGIESVVAPLGTALTSEQAQLVARYTRNVFLLYDGDAAGLRATFRAGDELLRTGATVRVVTFPDGEDPDTFVRRHGPAALEHLIANAIDVFERKIQILQRGGWFADLPKRRSAIDRLLPTLRATADQLLRDLYIARAAEASGVDRGVLAREVALSGSDARSISRAAVTSGAAHSGALDAEPQGRRRSVAGTADSPRARPTSAHVIERELVRALLRSPHLAADVRARLPGSGLRDERYSEIFEHLVRVGTGVTPDEAITALGESAARAYQELMAVPEAIQDAERTIEDALARLRVRVLEDEAAAIDGQMKLALEQEKDALMRRKVAIRDEIKSLGGTGARRYGARRGAR